MKMYDNYDFIVQIAKQYYLYGVTQKDIAAKYNISRGMISQLLTYAKNAGIVEVKYTINDLRHSELEYSKRLENIFSLDRAVVVPITEGSSINVLNICCEHAVDMINEKMKRGDTFGVTWGTTAYEFISTFHSHVGLHDITVVPLIGDIYLANSKVHINDMVQMLISKTNWKPMYVYAPAYTKSAEERSLYMQSSQMLELSAMWEKLDHAFVSAGRFFHYEHPVPAQVNKEDTEFFLNHPEEAIGDLCCNRLNIFGELVNDIYMQRMIAIPLKLLKKIPHVVGVALGAAKAYPAYVALKSGAIKTFICDKDLATALCAIDEIVQNWRSGQKS